MRSSENTHSAAWAFARYESVRNVLPRAQVPDRSDIVTDLSAISGRVDAFLLDAFGVLNVGDTAIPGAVDRMATLRSQGKRLLILSNSASYPTSVSAQKYRNFGFDFTDAEVITSRDALKIGLKEYPALRWGVSATRTSEIGELGVDATLLEDDPAAYHNAQGFILLGAGEWSDARQTLLAAALRQKPRPVLVGNPDIVAPREADLSLEPGYYAHDLAAQTGCSPIFYGKPFQNIFALARARLGNIPPHRTAMVGDTLHTDVLGGAAARMQTVLVTNHGLFAGQDVGDYIKKSKIIPHIISATT